MMHCGSSSTVKLLLSPSPTSSSSTTGVGGGKLACFHLGEEWEERGVNLGLIGRALGVDPASVRLNGYMLGGRGPDHVAASVTWRSLLAFFSARNLPTGRAACGGFGGLVAGNPAADDPIMVQGRPASPASLPSGQQISGFCFHYDHINRCHQEGGRSTNFKRKLASHDESPLGRIKLGYCNSSVAEDGEDGVMFCVKKKLRLEDENPIEKRRQMECDSGGSGPTQLFTSTPMGGGFTLNCVMGHRKRRREDELVATLPCKRIA